MLTSPFDGMLDSWTLALRAENKAPKTIKTYSEGVTQFAQWLLDHEHEDDVTLPTADLRREIRSFIADLNDRHTPATARNRYTALQQFWKWLVAEDEIPANPMLGMDPPHVVVQPVNVLSEEQLKTLMKLCSGPTLVARRDTAIIRLFMDTGIRRAEMAGLDVPDIDIRDGSAIVMGKGRLPRGVPFGPRTAMALDRYIRARAKHPYAESPRLWLGEKGKGPLTADGIRQMLDRRGETLGIHLHPHMLRHTFAHHWLADGGTEGDLMKIGGWKTRQMLDRYGASGASQRARIAHRRHGLSDKI